MTGVGIHPGDKLIVDQSLEPDDRSIVIAVVNGEFTLKRRVTYTAIARKMPFSLDKYGLMP